MQKRAVSAIDESVFLFRGKRLGRVASMLLEFTTGSRESVSKIGITDSDGRTVQ